MHNRIEVENRLRGVFSNSFDIAPDILTYESGPDSIPNWDSLKLMQLVIGIENEFGITLSNEEISQLTTLGNTITAVLHSLGNQ